MFAPAKEYIPQTAANRRTLIVWLFVASASVFVTAAIIGAPLARSATHIGFANTIYQTFSHVCHQLPERSFFIGGHPFAVCARCTGIYAGFALSSLLYPLTRSLKQIETPARKWLFVGAAPLAVDFVIEFSGLFHNTHLSRLLTGSILGAVTVFFVMPGLIDLSLRNWKRGKVSAHGSATDQPEQALVTTPYSGAASTPSDYSAPHRRI